MVIVYPPDAFIVAAGKFATFEASLNLTVSLVDLPWLLSITVITALPEELDKNGFNVKPVSLSKSPYMKWDAQEHKFYFDMKLNY